MFHISIEEKLFLDSYHYRFIAQPYLQLIETQIQETKCGFLLGHGKVDLIFTLLEMLKGPREFDRSGNICFVDLEKVYDLFHQQDSVGSAAGL